MSAGAALGMITQPSTILTPAEAVVARAEVAAVAGGAVGIAETPASAARSPFLCALLLMLAMTAARSLVFWSAESSWGMYESGCFGLDQAGPAANTASSVGGGRAQREALGGGGSGRVHWRCPESAW